MLEGSLIQKATRYSVFVIPMSKANLFFAAESNEQGFTYSKLTPSVILSAARQERATERKSKDPENACCKNAESSFLTKSMERKLSTATKI